MVKPIFLKYSREHFPAVRKDLNSVVKNIDTINSVFQRDNTRVSKPLSIFTPIPQGAGIAADGLQSVPIIKQGKFIDIESERKAKERNKILSNAVLETVPVFGKTPEITERVKSKDYSGATIVASQLALDFPNLIDDAVDAVDQLDKKTLLMMLLMRLTSWIKLLRQKYAETGTNICIKKLMTLKKRNIRFRISEVLSCKIMSIHTPQNVLIQNLGNG